MKKAMVMTLALALCVVCMAVTALSAPGGLGDLKGAQRVIGNRYGSRAPYTLRGFDNRYEAESSRPTNDFFTGGSTSSRSRGPMSTTLRGFED